MALELQYRGSEVALFGPELALTGDPGIDNPALSAAGFVAGALVKVGPSVINPDGISLHLVDGATDRNTFGAIITEPGEFANSIGPSASNRIAVARGYWTGNLYGSGYNTTLTYIAGQLLYAGTGVDLGKYTNVVTGDPVGIVTHAPTTIEPWLGIASLV